MAQFEQCMKQHGWFVHRHMVQGKQVYDKIRPHIKAPRPIFNGDGKRLQKRLPGELMQTYLPEVFEFCGQWGYQLREWVAIHSLADCQRQPAHFDYEPTPGLMKAIAQNENIPMSCLVAIEDTHIDIWEGSLGFVSDMQKLKHKLLSLQAGDVLFFRADLVHAGSAFEKSNTRLHAFCDKKGVRRTRNKTNIIEQHVWKSPRFQHLNMK